MMTKFQIKSRYTREVLFECELSASDGIPYSIRLGIGIRAAVSANVNLRFGYLRGADLRGFSLRGAKMHGVDLAGADMRDVDLEDADLYGANMCDVNLGDVDWIPKIEGIHGKVFAAASAEGALDTKSWHADGHSGRTHSRAGWVCVLAGERGIALENRFGPVAAATMIYQASDPSLTMVPYFYDGNFFALEDMKRLAEKEALPMTDTPRDAQTAPNAETETFQNRVAPWLEACFGVEISADRLERGDRMLEEVLELLQSGDYPRERVAALTAYVWDREKGEPAQEVGGVMVTLAAYCLAHDLDMHDAGNVELARVWSKVDKIRAKQAAKPTGSALPIPVSDAPAQDTADLMRRIETLEAVQEATAAARDVLAERQRQMRSEGWTPEHDNGHDAAEMAHAAACYAINAAEEYGPHTSPPFAWPWDASWWKPTTPRRDLVKAGALILAEIDRLDRAALGQSEQGGRE